MEKRKKNLIDKETNKFAKQLNLSSKEKGLKDKATQA